MLKGDVLGCSSPGTFSGRFTELRDVRRAREESGG
jgi:hypothetical protein